MVESLCETSTKLKVKPVFFYHFTTSIRRCETLHRVTGARWSPLEVIYPLFHYGEVEMSSRILILSTLLYDNRRDFKTWPRAIYFQCSEFYVGETLEQKVTYSGLT